MPELLYRRAANIDTSSVGGRAILFERASKRAIVINPTGARLWQLLEVPHSHTQLSAALSREFPDVEAARIEGDVGQHLRELLDQKLIVAS